MLRANHEDEDLKQLTGLKGSPSGPRELDANCKTFSLGW